MSNSYGTRNDAESIQVIETAVDRGINLVDTADFYGWGHNEQLVATALQGRREQVRLSSKFGYVSAEDGSLSVRGDPAYVKKACEDSLRRLNTDYIDLYFQHRVDVSLPIEDTVGAMADLVKEGKVRYLGLCEVSANTLRRAHAVHPITAVQAEYSLWTRDLEDHMLKVYDDLELVDRLGDIATRMRCTTSQLALAWLYNRNPRVVAICGCDTLDFLAENLGALHILPSEEQIEEIGQLFAPGQVHGDRYNPALMKLLDRD